MIFRRLLFLLAGAVALAVSAGVIVVALAYGVFALARPYVGPAGAAGVVALVAALLMGLLGVVLVNLAKPPKRKAPEPQNLMDALTDFVRSRPATAIGGALAAGVMAFRNPSYLGTVIRAFVEGNQAPPPKKGKR